MLRIFGWRPGDRSPSLLATPRRADPIRLIRQSCPLHSLAIASALPATTEQTVYGAWSRRETNPQHQIKIRRSHNHRREQAPNTVAQHHDTSRTQDGKFIIAPCRQSSTHANMTDNAQNAKSRDLSALLEVASTALQCDRSELHVSATPEGLFELRIARTFAPVGPSRVTLVGTHEQIAQWLNRTAVELGRNK